MIGFSKIKYMPYLFYHLDALTGLDSICVDLIYWNRDLKNDSTLNKTNLFEFKRHQDETTSLFGKVINFLKYRFFAERIIKKSQPDLIIVLHSMPGVLLQRLLRKKYSFKYIFDYRDITYEKHIFYKKKINKLANNSLLTLISSPKYKTVFDIPNQKKLFVSHNVRLIDLTLFKKNKNEQLKRKLTIAFWGIIRHTSINIRLIDAIKNDCRFTVLYYGPDNNCVKEIKKYLANNNIANVFFMGQYDPEQRKNMAQKADIIHNLYNFDDHNMNKAISNKFYDGIIFQKPQMCINGSYMAEVVKEYDIGIVVDFSKPDLANYIFNEYNRLFMSPIFFSNCEKLVSNVKNEVVWYQNKLKKYCEGCANAKHNLY